MNVLRTTCCVWLAILAVMPLRAEEKVTTVSHGDEVDITTHLVAGKYTIVEYYADW